MNGTRDDDRFGTLHSALQAARESHGDSPFMRMGMYVPTREEVRTLAPAQVFELLDLWFWEGPAELIPRDDQVGEVKAVLLERSDAATSEVQDIIALCDDFMKPRDPGRLPDTQVEEVLTALLAPYVRAEAIPEVLRRPVPALGDQSMLEAAEAGCLDDVHELVRGMFDLRRVQP